MIYSGESFYYQIGFLYVLFLVFGEDKMKMFKMVIMKFNIKYLEIKLMKVYLMISMYMYLQIYMYSRWVFS